MSRVQYVKSHANQLLKMLFFLFMRFLNKCKSKITYEYAYMRNVEAYLKQLWKEYIET